MATIERYVQPPRLYRYRSVEVLDRELNAIEERYLYCAAFGKLNDPMEGLFSTSRTVRESAKHRAIRASIRENKANVGMCSFSEVHDHELMWAHYADQFRGICISYSLTRLLSGLPKDVHFVRMFYNETEPTIHRTNDDPGQLAKMVLSYKSYKWLYEREWRMFAPLGKAYYRDIASVTRVYLGSRVSDRDRNEIMKRLKPLKIKVREMAIDKYSISFAAPSQS
jgi:hypothetical protein